MRYLGLLLAVGLAGCAHSGAQVQRAEGVDLSRYRAIGVPAFTDSKGQGALIAQDVNDGLLKRMYDPVDAGALGEILKQYKPEKNTGYGLEALETIRRKTNADTVVIGRMLPDWSAAVIVMFETEEGAPVLRAVVKPAGKHQAAFTDPAEVAQGVLRVVTGEQQ